MRSLGSEAKSGHACSPGLFLLKIKRDIEIEETSAMHRLVGGDSGRAWAHLGVTKRPNFPFSPVAIIIGYHQAIIKAGLTDEECHTSNQSQCTVKLGCPIQ